MEKAKVYFTKEITPEAVIKMYKALGKELPGKVAVKVHSGEKGNQNYLRPEFMRPMVEAVNGTIVECNTAYDGARNSTKKHRQLMEEHRWSKYFKVDLMDAEKPDLILPVSGGKVLKENAVGKTMANYDSLLVLSHFKGHPMGGYGGALKQLAIGCASSEGKSLIHSGGFTDDQNIVWEHTAEQDAFCFVSMVCNLSVDCDCCAVAEDPCMKDIGILSSLDPVALDQACIDLIYQSKDPGRDHFIERVETRHGIHTIEAAAELGYGVREYELICVD